MSVFYKTKPHDFSGNLKVVTCFIEYQNSLLLLRRSNEPLKWAIPGGKVENGESDFEALKRELFEELAIEIDQTDPIKCVHQVFVRGKTTDYQLILYRWLISQQLKITLNPKEHSDYQWTPIQNFIDQDLIDGQSMAFKIAYYDDLFHVDPNKS